MTIDGTDFDCAGQGSTYYSHKFGHSEVQYEIGLNFLLDDMCWINDQYETGRWNNIKIFRESLMSHLEKGERVEEIDGYIGKHPQYFEYTKEFTNPEEMLFVQQRIFNRQKKVNKRLKQLGMLKQRYRHDIQKHGEVLRASAVLIHI